MAEYNVVEFTGKAFAAGGGTDWREMTDRLNGHAEEGWKVHTASFPAPGRMVALLVREQAPRKAGVLVTETEAVTWGTCIGCGTYAALNEHGLCDQHLNPAVAANNAPMNATTYPRRTPG